MDRERLRDIVLKLIDFGKTTHLVSELSREDVEYILDWGQRVVRREESVTEIAGPVTICGSLFGDFRNLLDLLEVGEHPPLNSYLFLGDFVNRGKNSLEVVCLLVSYKLLYPSCVVMLRGAQETNELTRRKGLKAEIKYRFDTHLYKRLMEFFGFLPLASVVAGRIFACHGGLNRHVHTIDSVRRIIRPLPTLERAAAGIVFSEPIEGTGFLGHADESCGYGSDKVLSFLKAAGLDLICRTGDCVPGGFRYHCNRNVINIFSTMNFCGHGNPAALLKVARNGTWEVVLCKEEGS
ncbi:serine/threonine-protein phosphatase PP1 isozyme 7-like [Galendromus occidentalis]|uniref:Serine/threonine-protein phosphatase PP1 isozyme 7-like n=1 Tax=Galendromus occidentalis TaxID=34638 RepID=A0AAJ6QQ27_9ACAR|nr:serine/threonine-protein phosphatase PP1 isozyme 7-like [Galendromus occidentalis]